MDRHELQELLEATKLEKDMHTGMLTQREYDALEKMYLVLDLDNRIFAKIVKAVGVTILANRVGLWDMTLTAMDAYRAKLQYQRNKQEAVQMQHGLERLNESIEIYEKSQIF